MFTHPTRLRQFLNQKLNRKLVATLVLFAVLVVFAASSVLAQDADPNRILFTNVSVFDGVSDQLRSQDVLVENNLIN